MTRYVGLWHGGNGYSGGYWATDAEVFASVADAARILKGRADNGAWWEYETPACEWDDDGRAHAGHVQSRGVTPCVDRSSYIWLVPMEYARLEDLERDGFYGGVTHALELGPRGGVILTARPMRRR